MDWANERYIRIYIRDTLTWKRMRFEGQTVFMHVARKLDRAGRLPLDGMPPAEALSMLTDVPEEFAKTGFERLLGDSLGVFHVVDGVLVAPNWVEAQEAKASPAQRQRESREKKKELRGVTENADSRHTVTVSDGTPRDVTRRDAGVTGDREVSRGVTPSLAEPSLAEPSLASAPTGSEDSSSREPLLAFAVAWRDLTGRSEFQDLVAGCGVVGGTEAQALAEFRKACGGSVAEFRARVTARLANDRNDFNLSQTLVRWSSDLINVPAKAPAARSGPAAAYHTALKPRPDDGPAVTLAEALAGQEAPS